MIITIAPTTPRAQNELEKIPLKKGLRGYFFIAYLMFLGALLGLLSGILNMIYLSDFITGPLKAVFGAGFFFSAGYFLFLRPARRRLSLRQAAFEHGTLTEAVITKQSRTFIFWKSSRDWVIEAETILENGKRITGFLQTPRYQLAKNLKPGTKIQALYVKNQNILFLPLEMGIQVSITHK